MSLHIETNNLEIIGSSLYDVTPRKPQSPYEEWVMINDYRVPSGCVFNFLLAILNVEQQHAPIQAAADIGWYRIESKLSTDAGTGTVIFETKMIGCAPSQSKMFTPRLVILPTGDGIELRAGQGLNALVLRSSSAQNYRFWASFWGNLST